MSNDNLTCRCFQLVDAPAGAALVVLPDLLLCDAIVEIFEGTSDPRLMTSDMGRYELVSKRVR